MNLPTLLGSFRRKTFAASAVRPSRPRPRLDIMSLEARVVPATLPAPIVDQTSFRSIDQNAFAPSMATDPTNPNQIFAAVVIHGSNGTRIGYKFSSNGGTTWSAMSFPTGAFIENDGDPVLLASTRKSPL